MKEKAKIVEVDFDNAKEKQFMDELKIVGIGDVPQTYVINAKGQIAGAFSGTTDSKILVATATKQISGGGCCAPGSGKTCAPPAKPKS
ncbi:MAG: hypothetical protein EPO28_14260 [Saprospiraceae bacterium]|nr:MAG: hypothetical protein EPO28_14260 [Saprospiraceae bacterium]